MRVAVVIPVLDEAGTIESIVRAARATVGDTPRPVIVVDGGSVDDTRNRARAGGADVVIEPRRGYGRACAAGAQRAGELGAEVVAFLDGAGAEDPRDLPRIVAPILAGEADFVVGSRVLGDAEPGALRPAQRVGNHVATWLIAWLHGHRYTDLGSMRAIRCDALRDLGLVEAAHGWPAEMQVKAARAGLRIRELPIRYRRRRTGQSKVSGTLRGTMRAGVAILRVVVWGGP